MKELPIYKAIISDEDEGIYVISLVEMPATERGWVCFNENKATQKFAILNNDEHILAGVIMTADAPIYRIAPDGTEYYIMFTKDVIKEMSVKMLSDKTFNNIDIQHNGKLLPEGSVKLMELFITDKDKGILPNYIDVPEGSLMATYKIYDDELWDEIKNGELSGFSLEGIFSTIKVEMKTNKNIDKMNKVKEALRKILVSLGEVETDKGLLTYDDELIVGVDVYLEGEPAPDGEYKYDNKIIVVTEHKVAEIKEEAVEEAVEEVVDEVVDEKIPDVQPSEKKVEDNISDEIVKTIVEHSERLAKMDEAIKELRESLEKINKVINEPVVEPIEETFEKSSSKTYKNKAAEIASYLKK